MSGFWVALVLVMIAFMQIPPTKHSLVEAAVLALDHYVETNSPRREDVGDSLTAPR